MPEQFRYLPQEAVEHARSLGVETERCPAEHVYVCSISALTPLGNEDETFEGILQGKVGIGPSPAPNFRTNFAGTLGINLADFYSQEQLENMSTVTALSDILVRNAAKKAGVTNVDGRLVDEIKKDRFAICIGTGAGPTLEFIDTYNAIHSTKDKDGNDDLLTGSRKVDSRTGRRVFPQDVIARPAISIGAQGEGTCSSEACATGLSNLVLLYRSIKNGYTDAGVGGGVEASLRYHPEVATSVFARMWATSAEKNDATRASIPFSSKRSGFILSDGGAAFFLASDRFVEKHNLTPIAVVLNADKGMDAHHPTDPLPQRVAKIFLSSLVDEKTGQLYKPDLYVGHFTSTKVGDDKEAEALEIALQELANGLAVSAPKHLIGHQLGGAGAVTAMVAVMSILRNRIPGAYTEDIDERFSKFNIPYSTIEKEIQIASAAAFGFGGLGAAMTFGKV